MATDLVTVDWHGDVVLLTMNRPAKRNAFNAQMNAEFGAKSRYLRRASFSPVPTRVSVPARTCVPSQRRCATAGIRSRGNNCGIQVCL